MPYSIELETNRAGFDIVCQDGSRARFDFLGAPQDAFIGIVSNAVTFMAAEGVRATAYEDGGIIHLILAKEAMGAATLPFALTGLDHPSETDTAIAGTLGDSSFVASFFDCSAQGGNIAFSGLEARVEFSQGFSTSSLSFSAMAVSTWNVPAGHRAPDFSVGVFDDAGLIKPRPLRFGIPVISTVPALDNVADQADSDLVRLGAGAKTRTIYFRVVCNTVLEPALSVGEESALVSLRISLPSRRPGADKSHAALTLVSNQTNTQSVYKGSYLFGEEDMVQHLDGLGVVSAYMPMTIRIALPLKIQVSSTGSPFVETSEFRQQSVG